MRRRQEAKVGSGGGGGMLFAARKIELGKCAPAMKQDTTVLACGCE